MTAVPGTPVPPATAPEPGQAARAAWNDHWAGPDPYPASETQEETFERVRGIVADAAVDAWLAAAGGDGKPDEIIKRLLADVAEARDQLADVQRGAGEWIREAVARETAGLTAQRDAHKLRADHYEGLWRKEHGLPPEGGDDLARDHALAVKVLSVIARYKDDQVNPLTAFADIMDAAGEAQQAPPSPLPAGIPLRLARCSEHSGKVHAQLGSAGEWACLRGLADLAEAGVPKRKGAEATDDWPDRGAAENAP